MTHGWTGGQYSVYRILMGAWLLVYLILRPWGQMDGIDTTLSAVALFGCVPLLIGWRDHRAAIVAAVGLGLPWIRPDGSPATLFEMLTGVITVALPILHALTPPAPFWSFDAVGRDDPGNGWKRSRANVSSTWTVLSVTAFVAAIVLLRDPAWRNGTPEVVDGLPTGIGRALTFALLAIWLAFLPLAPIKTYRHWVWLISLVVNVIVLSVMGWPMLAAGMAVFHLAAFDPAWLPRASPDEPEALFYDGYCGLCHRWVRFVLAEDVDGKAFVLSPLQGDFIKDRLTPEQRDSLPDSIVVQTHDGQVLTRSSAILHILDRLGGLWRIGSWIGRTIPRVLRDAVYDGIASIRHKVFKRPSEACPMMPQPLRGRFKF